MSFCLPSLFFLPAVSLLVSLYSTQDPVRAILPMASVVHRHFWNPGDGAGPALFSITPVAGPPPFTCPARGPLLSDPVGGRRGKGASLTLSASVFWYLPVKSAHVLVRSVYRCNKATEAQTK
jgi:hypothetical protein